MFQAAISDRIYLKLVDGYRSYQLQADLFSYYTQTRGAYYASIVDDHPGASEHQLGLAADIGCWNGACELSYCFTQYPDYTWLKENSWKYGWIERYPEGKQSITNIVFSPWHYRYVGIDVAKAVYEKNLTYDEFYMLYLKPWEEGYKPADDILKATDFRTAAEAEPEATETPKTEESPKAS